MSRPFFNGALTIISVLILLTLGCTDRSGQASPPPGSVANYETVRSRPIASSIAQMRDRCGETGGSWSPLFQSCRCSANHWMTQYGCAPLEWSETAKRCTQASGGWRNRSRSELQACLRAPYRGLRVELDADQLTEAELRSLTSRLDSDSAALLGHWGLPLPQTDASTVFVLARSILDAEAFKDVWSADLIDSPASLGRVVEIRSGLRDFGDFFAENREQSRRSWMANCSDSISGVLPAGEAMGFCEDFFNWSGVAFGAAARPPGDYGDAESQWTEYGARCLPSCLQSSLARSRGSNRLMKASVLYREYLPIRRVLRIESPVGVFAGYFNPDGGVEGWVAVAKTLNGSSRNPIEAKVSAFDAGWNRLRDETLPFGDSVGLIQSLNRLRLPSRTRFDFENPTKDRPGRIDLLLVDTGLDIRSEPLRGRLAFNPDFLGAVQRLGQSGLSRSNWLRVFDFSPFSNSALPIDHLGEVIDEGTIIPKEPHGTKMASILVRNLPDAQVHFIPASGFARARPEEWAQKIRAAQARVVNISYDFSSDRPDCANFFATLFDSMPDVLFVVGAGNTGTQDPDVCPANVGSDLARRNVLTVAGVDRGQVASRSSYGWGVAKVAAPFSAVCSGLRTENCAGTSVSAAWVSNWAAKRMLRTPGRAVSASELVNEAMASCQAENLPVRCGGTIPAEGDEE